MATLIHDKKKSAKIAQNLGINNRDNVETLSK